MTNTLEIGLPVLWSRTCPSNGPIKLPGWPDPTRREKGAFATGPRQPFKPMTATSTHNARSRRRWYLGTGFAGSRFVPKAMVRLVFSETPERALCRQRHIASRKIAKVRKNKREQERRGILVAKKWRAFLSHFALRCKHSLDVPRTGWANPRRLSLCIGRGNTASHISLSKRHQGVFPCRHTHLRRF